MTIITCLYCNVDTGGNHEINCPHNPINYESPFYPSTRPKVQPDARELELGIMNSALEIANHTLNMAHETLKALAAAGDMMYDALLVVKYLIAYDPKALEIVNEAIEAYKGMAHAQDKEE